MAFGYSWQFLDSSLADIVYTDAICPRVSKWISVRCIETGYCFSSLRDAVKWLVSIGYSKAVGNPITVCAKGKAKTAYGHTWEFINRKEVKPLDTNREPDVTKTVAL